MWKYHIWNPSKCTHENGKYLESIINHSVITCDEIVEVLWSESRKTMPINFGDKKATCKMDDLYTLPWIFVNYHVTIDNRWYLLLLFPYKTSIKQKKKNYHMMQTMKNNKLNGIKNKNPTLLFWWRN